MLQKPCLPAGFQFCSTYVIVFELRRKFVPPTYTVDDHLDIQKRSAVAEMGDRLACTIDMGKVMGAAVPLSAGGTGSPAV